MERGSENSFWGRQDVPHDMTRSSVCERQSVSDYEGPRRRGSEPERSKQGRQTPGAPASSSSEVRNYRFCTLYTSTLVRRISSRAGFKKLAGMSASRCTRYPDSSFKSMLV